MYRYLLVAIIAFYSCSNSDQPNNTSKNQPPKQQILTDSIKCGAYKVVLQTTIFNDTLNVPNPQDDIQSNPIVLQQQLWFFKNGRSLRSSYTPAFERVMHTTLRKQHRRYSNACFSSLLIRQ